MSAKASWLETKIKVLNEKFSAKKQVVLDKPGRKTSIVGGRILEKENELASLMVDLREFERDASTSAFQIEQLKITCKEEQIKSSSLHEKNELLVSELKKLKTALLKSESKEKY